MIRVAGYALRVAWYESVILHFDSLIIAGWRGSGLQPRFNWPDKQQLLRLKAAPT